MATTAKINTVTTISNRFKLMIKIRKSLELALVVFKAMKTEAALKEAVEPEEEEEKQLVAEWKRAWTIQIIKPSLNQINVNARVELQH